MTSIEVDGVDQRIWKADIKKMDYSALAAFTSAEKAGNKYTAMLKLIKTSCTVRLLMSDRSLTYESSEFLLPDMIAAIDTRTRSIRTTHGTIIPVKLSKALLSDVESTWVQYAQIKDKLGQLSDSTLVQSAQIKEKLGQVADQSYQLRQENEELRRLAAGGYLDFVRKVDLHDFCCFLSILIHGDRAKAARAMNIRERAFYQQVDSWKTRGPDYRKLHSLVKAWKKGGGKVTVPLGASLQSSGAQDETENPVTNAAVFEQIKAGNFDPDDRQKLLQDTLIDLSQMNDRNWWLIRHGLVPEIKAAIPQ